MHAVFLYVLVGGGDVGVSCLVSCHYNTDGIGEVSDAAVLQRIELVAVVPAKGFAHLLPSLVEVVRPDTQLVGLKLCAEEVVVGGLRQHAKVYHQFEDGVGDCHLGIFVVLAELL